MNGEVKQARRYHWLSEGMTSFVDAPHAAIEGPGRGQIVNLTDHRAEASRHTQLELLGSLGPDGIARELSKLEARDTLPIMSPHPPQMLLPHLDLPEHHDVPASDVVAHRLHGNLAAAADRADSGCLARPSI
jgi:hypothetical protein